MASHGRLIPDALAASAACAAVLAALGPGECLGFSPSIVSQCRGLRRELPHDLRYVAEPFIDPLCDTLAEGHWALFLIVAANSACYVPSRAASQLWSISRNTLSHERLLSYQLAHANLAHISGNMLTLLAVGSEVSTALNCNQQLLLALYVACGWVGGYAAALLSQARTVGASGSVSGVIVALSVLRPNSAVHILGDVDAANPLTLLLGTLAADLSRGGVSWQAHLGGGITGGLLAWLITLVP